MSNDGVPTDKPHMLKELVEVLAIEAARKDHDAFMQGRTRGRPTKRLLKPLATEAKRLP